MNIPSNLFSSQLGVIPAVEPEGSYLGKKFIDRHEIYSDITRLPEHDFLEDYPMSAGFFLTNAI